MKFSLKRQAKYLATFFSILIILPIIYIVINKTTPYVLPALNSIAKISALLSFSPKDIDLKNTAQNDDSQDVLNFIDDFSIWDDENFDVYVPTNENPSSSSSQAPSETSSTPPSTKPENAGTILRRTYKDSTASNYVNIGNTTVQNLTKLASSKILDWSKQKPAFKIETNTKPQVLIMHTHTTESYQHHEGDWFDKSYNSRTTDNTKNMIRVGDEIQKQLESAGIGVIHDKTLHDYPSYNGAYERSAKTVQSILKDNPSIKIVLDVHRDAIQPDNNTMIAPTTTINGKKSAQIMIISGCDDGTMNMPKYMENFKFTSLLQKQMATDYPTLARPVMFAYRKYNQNITTGSILLEMGGHGNTLDEAIYAGELLGKSLAKSLLTLK